MEGRPMNRDDFVPTHLPGGRIRAAYRRELSEEDLRNLAWGHAGGDVEDRWGFFVEDGRMHVFRNWVGCVEEYDMELGPGPDHEVLLPDSGSQGTVGSRLELLGELLDIWCRVHVPPEADGGPPEGNG